jgi:hypothetical protein
MEDAMPDERTLYRCQNCDWSGPMSELGCQLKDVPNLLERISPGESVPAGECPKCRALVSMGPGMLEKVWVILPPDDDPDWDPGRVYETWEQAVARLTVDIKESYDLKHIREDIVEVWSRDDDDEEPYGVRIVSVPIEYRRT